MAAPQQTAGFTLQIRRTFAAPREKVFAAWAQREQLEQWMCKDVSAHTVIHHEQDIRTGGRYRMEVRDTTNGETYTGYGIYREVKPPEKIVFTWSWTKKTPRGTVVSLHPGSSETLVTVEFFARGNDSTEIVLTHATFDNVKDRDDHNRGWNGCFDILARVLQTTSTPS
jgi:uncharacterized protein YndB with AHSA1/START domain